MQKNIDRTQILFSQYMMFKKQKAMLELAFLISRFKAKLSNAKITFVISSIIFALLNFGISHGLEGDLFVLEENTKLLKTDFIFLENIHSDDFQKTQEVFIEICKKQQASQSKNTIGNPEDWNIICSNNAIYGSPLEFYQMVMSDFKPFIVLNNQKTSNGLFTGYYMPILEGSLKKDDEFKYPVYKKPENLNLTREEIEKGKLKDLNLEVVYLKDRVDLYSLHIQGSGFIKLRDGTIKRLVFDGKNNYEYYSIGKYMIETKKLTTVNGTTLNEYLKTHSKNEVDEIMFKNKSYIFFKFSNDNAVYGAHGTKLFDDKSVAIDTDFIPFAIPLFLQSDDLTIKSIMFTQDRGSGIKGPTRADIFRGSGKEAKQLAEQTNNQGFYYIILHEQLFKYLKKVENFDDL